MNNMLVIVVGGLPIAMPTILSVTMALGASALAKKKAIVSRLNAVEEMAGMEVLCSDKTGTLTKNELSLKDPIVYVGEVSEVIFSAALASKPENGDSIDIGRDDQQSCLWLIYSYLTLALKKQSATPSQMHKQRS
jgi:H+-transporting ATPase